MKRRVHILGGGVCGLAAALRALEIDSSLEVTIVEGEERVGGLARSLTVGGQHSDMGPHRIFTELPDVQDFLEDLAGPELKQVTRKSKMWLHGRWIEYPPKPLEIIKLFGPLKLAMVGFSYIGGKLRRLAGSEKERDNFESIMTSAFGEELYKLIVLGYTKKVWKMDPRELHGDIARVRVSAGGLDQMVKRVFIREKSGQETALKKFYYIPGGVEQLAIRMRDRIQKAGARIVTQTRVAGLKPLRTGHWRIDLVGPDGTQRTEHTDLVISTIPVTDLVDMLQEHRPDPKVAGARNDLKFIANFLVCLVVNRPQVTPNHWLYFPGKDTIFNRGYEPKNFSADLGTSDRSMLLLEITCHHGDKVWNATDKQLVESTIRGLAKTGLVQRHEVVDSLVHRIPYTYPIYDLAYRRRLSGIWKYLATFPNLLSSGRQGLYLHNNMDHSIHMGFRAATVALKEHPENPERHFYKEVRRFQQFRIVD